MGVAVSPRKMRIIRDLIFQPSSEASRGSAGTDFALASEVKLGKVLRDVVWQILWLRAKFGTTARIVLTKLDETGAFRQVAIDWLGPLLCAPHAQPVRIAAGELPKYLRTKVPNEAT